MFISRVYFHSTRSGIQISANRTKSVHEEPKRIGRKKYFETYYILDVYMLLKCKCIKVKE